MADPILKAREVKQRYEARWLAIEEVLGVGIGLVHGQRVGIIVSVSRNPQKIRKIIPAQVEGIPVKVQKSGEFNAQ